MPGRSAFEEGEGRMSLFRILDDTAEELGLPGLRDMLPPPQEILSETVGLASPNDFAEALKERIRGAVKSGPRPPRL